MDFVARLAPHPRHGHLELRIDAASTQALDFLGGAHRQIVPADHLTEMLQDITEAGLTITVKPGA